MALLIRTLDTVTWLEKWSPYEAGVATTDASKLTAGILNDARLSANVVLRSLLFGSDGKIKTELYNAGVGGVDAPMVVVPHQINYKEFRPSNYGAVYTDGSQQQGFQFFGYTHHENRNSSTNRPDTVVQWYGYNSNAAGARINTKDISVSKRTELYYDIDGIGACMEDHVSEFTDMKGTAHRGLSWYVRRNDGMQGFWNMQGTLSLFATQLNGSAPKQFASIGEGVINLNSLQAGRMIGFAAQSFEGAKIIITSSGGVGTLQITSSLGSSFYYDGYGKMNVGLPVYANDTEAKAAGKVQGDWYKSGGFIKYVQ